MTRPEKTIGGQQQQQRWLLPVRVETNVPWERPVIADGAQARPAPMPLTLTVTVSVREYLIVSAILQNSVAYLNPELNI